jgi:LmbE family N-acetylglucosaminyl deacetylase
MMQKILLIWALTASMASLSCAQAPRTYSSADILQQMKQLKVVGSVLYIAAHPDDENTRLLAYLAGERNYRTAYMSLTRGDGGQNLLGDEQGIELGLIRTQELLAARRIDGAEQFFSRAYDFGFSKSSREALKIWQEDTILNDVVWVIRNFKPDVIITRFPEDSRAGHGHHSASAILAREAFAAAADPNRFPEQLKGDVHPWQAKRILWNTFNFGGNNTTDESQLKMEVGAFNEVLGKGYGEIAAESRSQHKSQGFGATSVRGNATEYFKTVAGDPPVHDLMDGVVTDWSRLGVPGIDGAVDSLIGAYNPQHPSLSLSALESLQQRVRSLPVNNWTIYKLHQIERLENACNGLWMEAYITQPHVVLGDDVPVTVSLVNRGPVPVKVTHVFVNGSDSSIQAILPQNTTVNYVIPVHIWNTLPISQPYWLRKEKTEGHFVVDDQYQIGKPQNDPPLVATVSLDENGVRDMNIPVQYRHTDPVRGELYQPVEVTPALLVYFKPDIVLNNVVPAVHPDLKLTLVAMKDIHAGSLAFSLSDGKTAYVVTKGPANLVRDQSYQYDIPYNENFMRGAGGKQVRVSASVTTTDSTGSNAGKPKQSVTTYDAGLKEIDYPHIPFIHYFHGTVVTVVGEQVKVTGKRIGYIEGAGDKLPAFLPLMGYEVTLLGQQDIMGQDLSRYDAIITGIRAFNTQPWLRSALPKLLEYVHGGGVLLEQYNNFRDLVTPDLGPYPFRVGPGRVTDENAAVTFLEPGNAAFHYPNEITQRDFEGWNQERGLYYVDDNMDARYSALLGMQDPGESFQKGSLIVGGYGKGKFVYTSLAFFRQLPQGVPGAYRLMANLLAKPAVK